MAFILKERKIGGWVDLKDYHLNSTIYRMYKSLVDMVNTEMKGKKTPSDTTTTGGADSTPEKGEGDSF